MTFRRDLSEEGFGHVDTWRKSISGRGHGRHMAVGSSGLRTVQEDWVGAGRSGEARGWRRQSDRQLCHQGSACVPEGGRMQEVP